MIAGKAIKVGTDPADIVIAPSARPHVAAGALHGEYSLVEQPPEESPHCFMVTSFMVTSTEN